MIRIGVICTPVPGHLNPMFALCHELQERGYSIAFFNVEDLRSKVETEGFEFSPLGQSSHPLGSLTDSKTKLGTLSGFSATRFVLKAVEATTEMICRDAPTAIRNAKIDLLLVDQMEPAGATVAQHLGVPYVTVANALLLNREPAVPPALSPWCYRDDAWGRLRNHVGYFVGDLLFRNLLGVLNRYRRTWKLPHISRDEETFSPLAQISQLVPEFDYPRSRLQKNFHFTGPLRNKSARHVEFPWHKLNEKRLVYASLGTLQGGKLEIFELIAEACRGLDVQLLITHGGGLSFAQIRKLPGNPLVVPYAPQLYVLACADLTVTHAGLNTVLDSFSHGVPVIAMPITFEQPAIAERVRWSGGGEAVKLQGMTPARLRTVMDNVLNTQTYYVNAGRMKQSIELAGGVRAAADIVAKVLSQRVSNFVPIGLEEECMEVAGGSSR